MTKSRIAQPASPLLLLACAVGGGSVGALLANVLGSAPEAPSAATALPLTAPESRPEDSDEVAALRSQLDELAMEVSSLTARQEARRSLEEASPAEATLPLSETELRSWMASVDMRLSGGGLQTAVEGALEDLRQSQADAKRRDAQDRAASKLAGAEDRITEQVAALTESLMLVGDQPDQLRVALLAQLDRTQQLSQAWNSGSYTNEELGAMKQDSADQNRADLEAFLTPDQIESLSRQTRPGK